MANPTSHSALHLNYFQFTLKRVPNMVYFCQEVNIPGLMHTTADQGTVLGLPVKIPGGAFTFEPFSVTFKVDEQIKNWLEIFNWIKSVGNYNKTSETSPYKDRFSDAKLIITNSSYKSKFAVNFKNIFPNSLSGIKFSTVLPDAMEAVATATFSFTNFDIETLDNP